MILRARRDDEQGWALVTAIMLMAIMLGTILSVATYVDSQTKLGADSRKRETAFNLAEAAMNMQTYALSRDWPGIGQAATPYPVCGPSSVGLTRCPSPSELANLIASPDVSVLPSGGAGMSWQTQVRDNSPTPCATATSTFYQDSVAQVQPSYDCNNDGKLWVRATAMAHGKTRTIIELVRVEPESIDMPHAAVVAGKLEVSNNGNKTAIDTTGSTGANGFVGVRCAPYMGEPRPCLADAQGTAPTQDIDKWNSLVQTQISPYAGHVQLSYQSAPAITEANRYQLKLRAIADGTYYPNGCPATLKSAAVNYIESGDCTFTSNSVWNSLASPGIVIMNSGTLTFKGTADFWGVIYAVNAQNSSGTVVNLAGSGTVHGGVFADGNGVVTAGGTANTNIKYEDTALNGIKAYGNAGLIQNTWREIKGS
jgi:Tfp pilus assembly protein PilX